VTYVVNHTPAVSAVAKTILEDQTLTFAAGDFTGAYTDSDGNPLSQIKIESVSANGTLKAGSVTLTAGSIVLAADLGTVTFTPSANYNGSTTFTWNAFDGAIYSTAASTVTVNITAVNDAPSFTKGANQSHTTNAGAISINGWATAISAGPSDESSQTLTFSVSNNNNSLFSVQPAISATTGTLTYTVAAATNGTATVSVTLSDNGGTANSGANVSSTETFTVSVSAVANNVPVAGDATVAVRFCNQCFYRRYYCCRSVKD
jgi:hypothetical protein